jgi:hypothetical protein
MFIAAFGSFQSQEVLWFELLHWLFIL